MKACASRTREAVAMALQRLGKKNMGKLLDAMETWSTGNWFEKRAAAADAGAPPGLFGPG